MGSSLPGRSLFSLGKGRPSGCTERQMPVPACRRPGSLGAPLHLWLPLVVTGKSYQKLGPKREETPDETTNKDKGLGDLSPLPPLLIARPLLRGIRHRGVDLSEPKRGPWILFALFSLPKRHQPAIAWLVVNQGGPHAPCPTLRPLE